MQDLYAPWRSPYSVSLTRTKEEHGEPIECVFCNHSKEQRDENNFLLKRFKHCYVVLNKYPYNAGHLMVIPFNHVKNLDDLSTDTRTEIMEATTRSITIIQKELKCHGINVGLNLGRASGAGIPSHIHLHILPRWEGDTNFLPTLADTKVISFNLKEIYDALKPAFNQLT